MSSNEMTYKILGTTDEVTTCQCCGKPNLKKTVVLDNGIDTVYYGTHCAARATGNATKAGKANAEFIRAAECLSKTQEFINRGTDLDKIVKWVWNRYGFSAELKDGGIKIWVERHNPVILRKTN